MKRLTFLLTLLLTLTACNQGTTPPPPQPEVVPSRVLGQVDITFSVDPATQELTTTALNAGLSTQGDRVNSVDAKALSKGLIDKDGTRYLYGTFEFANNSGRALDNLSLYALNTPGASAGSAVSNLRNARFDLLTDAATVRSIRPTHRLRDSSGSLGVKADEADFQAFTSAEAAQVQGTLGNGFEILEYGYVARNAEGGRSIAAGGKGYVSFAIAFPFVPERSAEFPFSFTISYLTVNEPATRVTLYPEFDSAAEVCARAVEVNAAEVVVLGDTPNPNCAARTLRLNDVKIATATGDLDAQYLLRRGPGEPEPEPQPQVNVKVNFQDENTAPPAGYLRDFGEAFGVRSATNQGNGQYSYGWIDVNNSDPIGLNGLDGNRAQGRNRSGFGQSDLRLATTIHMQHPSTPPTGYWEIAVPNGTYNVTVAVGDADAGQDPEVHRINAEGVTIANNFTPSGPRGSDSRHTTGSETVTVTDGRLTLDYAGGGINTKLNYVEIETSDGPVDTSEPEVDVNTAELIFSGNKNTTSAAKQIVVNNTGAGTLTINSVTTSGDDANSFTVTNPGSIASGQSASINVTFTPGNNGGALSTTLILSSNDSDEGSVEVKLYGLSADGYFGQKEPTLQDALTTLGYDVDTGWDGLTFSPNTFPVGDEITESRFQKAGAGNVTLTPLARYSPDEVLPFGYYTESSNLQEVAAIGADSNPSTYAQTLFPGIIRGGDSFDPGSATFGIYVDSQVFNRVSYTEDSLNTGVPHATRIYPAKDRSGQLLANSYIIGFEDATNGDYQDYVFLLSNVTPVQSAVAAGCAPRSTLECDKIAVSLPYNLAWDGDEEGLADKNGVDTGFTMVDPPSARLSADVPVFNTNVPGYEPGLLEVSSGALTITATKGIQFAQPSGSGITSTETNSQINALGVGFRADAQISRLETAILNPSFPTTRNYEQAGLWFGLDEDNYVKLIISNDMGSGNILVQLATETDASGTLVFDGDTKSAPFSQNSFTDIKLSLVLNPDTNEVTAFYTLDGNSEVLVGTRPIPASFFDGVTLDSSESVSFAGILTTKRRAQASSPLAFSFGDFSLIEQESVEPSGALSLENRDWTSDQLSAEAKAHFNSWLAFNRIESDADNPRFHDSVTLRLKNSSSSEPLKITRLNFSNNTNNNANTPAFTLPGGEAPSLSDPLEIAAGSFYDLEVKFVYTRSTNTSNENVRAQLLIGSSDAQTPTRTVQLGGSWQRQEEGGNEPDVTKIIAAFGFDTTIRNSGERLNNRGRIEAIGEEVISPFWNRADEGKPIYVRQLAAYHTCCTNTASVFLQPDINSGGTDRLFTHNGKDAQSFLPLLNGSNSAPAQGTKTPPKGTFGFKIDPEWSDPNRNNKGPDDCSAGSDTCGQHVRFWPARDLNGDLIPNAYFMVMDYAGINYDFNDNVYFLSNVTPAPQQ